jgi:hypothetical protein
VVVDDVLKTSGSAATGIGEALQALPIVMTRYDIGNAVFVFAEHCVAFLATEFATEESHLM